VVLVLRRKLVRLAAVVWYWGDIDLKPTLIRVEQPWGEALERAVLCNVAVFDQDQETQN